ncbi:MAG: PorT family protein [Bacteroidales bacterium]|nr:PorT family protein [Bacteroidales bacterium]MCF8454925.1 PorT family protein [Bacteroidales bacterium]
MRRFIGPVLFVFAALGAQAQLSAEKHNLKTYGAEVFEFSTSAVQFDAGAQREGFFEKRLPEKSKSSQLAYGLIAGPTLSNTINTLGKDISGTKMKFGMQFGLIGNYQASNLFGLKSGLVFTQKGYKGDYEDYLTSANVDYKNTFNYLSIPVLATINFGDDIHFYGNAGPVVGIWIGGRSKSDGNSEKIDDGMAPADLAVQFGGGTIIPLVKYKESPSISLIADVNYQLGLSGVYYESSHVYNAGFAFGVGVLVNAEEAFDAARQITVQRKETRNESYFDRKNPHKFDRSNLTFCVIAGPTLFKIGDKYFGSEMKTGMQLGVISTYQRTENFGYKTGLIYTQKGFKDNFTLLPDSVEIEETITYHYLNIPILATYGYGEKVIIYGNAGPVIGIFMGGKDQINDDTYRYTKIADNTDLSLLVGGGAIIPVAKYRNTKTISLLADFNYQLGIGDIYGSISDIENRGFAFALGVMIGGF